MLKRQSLVGLAQATRTHISTVSLIALAAWVTSLALNAPGHLSLDSVVQLLEGRSGMYESMHPPIMSLMLGFFDKVYPGTTLYLLFTSSLFYGSLLIIGNGSPGGLDRKRLPMLVLLVLALFSPSVLIYQGIIWKDILFANLSVAAFASCIAGVRNENLDAPGWPYWMTAVILAGTASLVRQNGLLIPIGIAVARFWTIKAKKPGALAQVLNSIAILVVSQLVALTLGLFVQMQAANAIPDTTKIGVRLLRSYDIAGMVANGAPINSATLASIDPSDLSRFTSYAKQSYSPARLDMPGSSIAAGELSFLTADQIGQLWLDMIRKHPLAYMRHRFDVFGWMVWPQDLASCLPVHLGISAEPRESIKSLAISPGMRDIDYKLYDYSKALFGTPVFRNGFWLLSSAAIAFALPRSGQLREADKPLIILQVTALLFALSFLVGGIACDVRYLFLVHTAVCVGLARLSSGCS